MEFGYYLMIKEAEKLGIKYLCKCADYKNPLKYTGSGVYWRRLLKKHNIVDIKTTILGHYSNAQLLREAGEWWSKKLDIVKDKSWANLCEEIGDGGPTVVGRMRICNEILQQERLIYKDDNIPDGWRLGCLPKTPKSKEAIEKSRQFHLGRKRSAETRNKMCKAIRKKRITITCDICAKQITAQNLKRHQIKCSLM
jgi:hypothetical protein